MSPGGPDRSAVGDRLHRDSYVFDLHTHGPGFLPEPARTVWRAATRGAPAEVGLDALASAGVDAVIAKAVGDPIATRWFVGRSPWEAVEAQLARIECQATAADAVIARSADALIAARTRASLAIMLGVEGADALGEDVDRVDAWYERGVRSAVLVHLGDNRIGTTCLPWQRYAGPLPVWPRRAHGLSAFGGRVVERMNRLGMVVDVAHCDRSTLLDIVDRSSAPVVSSHTGARAVQDFARYLADDELEAIAATGGLVGLWPFQLRPGPFRTRHTGVRDVPELIRHARHIADLIGPAHLALGTDLNGVPGLMAGYDGPADLAKITAALLDAGFAPSEVRGILGENALRVLRRVEASAS